MTTSEYRAPYNTARVIRVIETTLALRGDGKSPKDPVRHVTQYWTLDGKLICELDSFMELAVQIKERET